ncbi:MAG: DEAD/DEAH box helicase, partial [Planctomycetes bacterium]|nr:DEAD/DEAH box helicase [Planctomycetota bacterium]
HNVLVSAPTGAGKTLVAEYAIADAVHRGRRCIYTAPIKALSNQKYRDFRDDPEIDVGLMTGDVTLHPGAQVLIMTTEILRNSILEDPGSLHDVEYVIFDEVHFMDDVERGTVWEESLIFAPRDIRFICLSATISNLDEFGDWLGEIRGHDIVTVRSDRRPVPLHFRFFSERSGSFEPRELEAVRRREASAPQKRSRSRARRGRRGRRGSGDDPTRPPEVAPLFDALERERLLPALVFAFSRKACEAMARRAREHELLDREEERRMVALQGELIELFQLDEGIADGEIFAMARHGVGYHHAGMLPAHKEVVERFFTSGLIKLLFTTETFALGINMPARTVVFHSLRKFDGVNFDYMRTRDFLQMAGRAGRQGLDAEGLVYALLSPKDLDEAPLKRLLEGRPESIESRFRLSFSTLLHLLERLGRERVHEAWEKSFNQFQHREESAKRRDRNARLQHAQIDRAIDFLESLGYHEGGELRPRGRLAQRINGFELQITELMFRGVLEDLPPEALAVVFVGLIHEERRRFGEVRVPARYWGDLRRQVDRVLRELVGRSYHFDLPVPPKRAEWGLTPAVLAWMQGAPFDELETESGASAGDLCRAFRMAIQLMRQVRRAIDRDWDLYHALGRAMEGLNRDEVDARHQLELG